jgi:LPXTG-motif cell wall-anchored protein
MVSAALATRRPKVLAQTIADADGSASLATKLDDDLSGEVIIVMIGESSGHGSRQAVTIGTSLPATGPNTAYPIGILILSAAIGALFSLIARRRL